MLQPTITTARPLYRIRSWEKYFEVAQSRKAASLKWISKPNKHDGKAYARLALLPDFHEIYGSWCLILEVASKCTERGILADDDGPLSAEDIALMCRGRAEKIEQALTVLSSPEIGWVERLDTADKNASTPESGLPSSSPEVAKPTATTVLPDRSHSAPSPLPACSQHRGATPLHEGGPRTSRLPTPETPAKTGENVVAPIALPACSHSTPSPLPACSQHSGPTLHNKTGHYITPPPPTTATLQSSPAMVEKRESVVVARLIELGVDKAAETLAEAYTHGMDVDQILAILEFAESHRTQYGPGAIVHRLKLANASQLPPDRGWPPMRSDPLTREKIEATEQANARAKEDQLERDAAERRFQMKQLELQFGSEIDARTPQQLAELLPPNDPVLTYLFHRRFGPKIEMVRSRLLEVMAAACPAV